MHRFIPAKRTLALVVAGTAVATAAALSVPALADTRAPAGNHRAARAASVPDIIIGGSFATPLGGVPQELGNAFGGRADIKASSDESVIGTAYSICAKDEVGAEQDQVLCTTVLKFTNENLITLSAVVPVAHEGVKAKTFDGVATGGGFAYEGVSGVVHFVPRSDGAYDVSFA
ncbi:hypothetical protein ACWDRR_04140 [Kitasatospora sp. NPDC003701]